MSKDIKNDKDLKINMVIDNLVQKANIAMEEMMKLNQEEIDKAVKNPVVIHFIEKFTGRPWIEECIHPMKKRYLDLLNDINCFGTALHKLG